MSRIPALLAALLVLAAAAGSRAEEIESRFSVLAYNVHGLFPLAAADDPRSRMPTIGWLTGPYDIVLYQEDFEYHDVLKAQMDDSEVFRGPGIGYDPRRLFGKLVMLPFNILIPRFSAPYGSGVSTFVDFRLETGEVRKQRYRDCHQWIGGTADCWAAKGFLVVRVLLPGGGTVDVYNTHLEAGPHRGSVLTREKQLIQMLESIDSFSKDRAVVVGGDFNADLNREFDADLVRDFRERAGLTDSGAGAELPVWKERDFILYRPGGGVRLSVVDSGEAMEFVSRGRALSDHPAIYAWFEAVVEAR